jgi:3-oxoacyl-[acyl-carrier-protein] synthase III
MTIEESKQKLKKEGYTYFNLKNFDEELYNQLMPFKCNDTENLKKYMSSLRADSIYEGKSNINNKIQLRNDFDSFESAKEKKNEILSKNYDIDSYQKLLKNIEKHNIKYNNESKKDLLKKNEIENEQVHQFIFHQANAFMLNFIRKKLQIGVNKFFIDLEDGGNTVSCTIPIALKKYALKMEENKLETIALIGFGVGLSWAGGIIKINSKL